MILQHNYVKVIEYSQKAFKIFCRRLLGGAIIKALQKKNIKQKQLIADNEENYMSCPPKIISEKSILYLEGLRDESQKAQSAISQLKRAMNIPDRYQQLSGKGAKTLDRFQISYGDLVYIQFSQKANGQTKRAKHFLNKLRFCSSNVIGVGSSSDLRCVFQIVYPGELDYNNRNILIKQSSLVSFRTISKKQYLRVKNSKIVYSEQFGKQLQLSSSLTQGCVFEIKNSNKNEGDDVISGTQVIIKMFGQQLYMNVLQQEEEIFFCQSPTLFSLKKLKKKIDNFIPKYFKMRSKKFQTSILGTPIDLQTICQKKTVPNIIAINQQNDKTKINAITFIEYDFTKIPEQDLKIIFTDDLSITSVSNCWEFIQCFNRSDNTYYQLYNPVIGLGVTIKFLKLPKNIIKLSPNSQDFLPFKITYHDQDVISFAYQQSQQELDIIFDRNTQKYAMTLSEIYAQNQSKKIKIKQIDTKISYMICQMIQVLDVLKGVYEFLSTWGNEVDEKSQIVYYSVKQIKLGSSMMLKKVKEMRMVLKILKNYLQNNQYSIQQVQNTINSMKILDMIINICKIITNKIGFGHPVTTSDDPEDINYNITPFCFAKNNLEDILKSIFVLILRLTKDNFSNSNSVMSQIDFFNMILIQYPEQIGQILQESIKNLSVFTSKSSNQSNELFLWAKLIQPVRQDTIRIQKTYIDIIAQVVVDPNDKGIPFYQNKSKQLLFIQNVKRKGIPKFGVDEQSGKAIIIFENQSSMRDFFKNNPHLSKLNLVYLNSASYFIEQFYIDRYSPDYDIYEQYLGYISSVIKMFRNLCRDRNKKLFKIVEDWGISDQHIQIVLRSKKISWNLKANYLSLWSAIYIDEDPFLTFQKRQSKCHFWQKIQKYNLNSCTGIIFKQYTDENLADKKLNQTHCKIYPVLTNFFEYFKSRLPNSLGDINDLKSFYTILKTLHEIVELGYMTLKSIKYYLILILECLRGIFISDNPYLKKSIQQEISKMHQIIVTKFLQILHIFEDIWVQIYGIQFLINFYQGSSNKNYTLNRCLMQEKWMNILQNKFQYKQTNITSSTTLIRKKTRYNALPESESLNIEMNTTDMQNLPSFQSVDNQIIQFCINLLSRRILEQKPEAHQSLMDMIKKKKIRNQRVCSYLRQIMILNNIKQQEINKNFSGRQPNKLLNWLKIQELVQKIGEIQKNNKIDIIEERCKKEKILQLNNILVKVIREMKIYNSQNSQMLIKCQTVLQKLNVHLILLDLFKYSEKPAYKQLIKTVLDFFKEFIKDNQINKKKLSVHIQKLTKNLNFLSLVQIIPTLIKISENKQQAYKAAHELIYKVSPNTTTIYLLMIIGQVLEYDPTSKQTLQLKSHLSKRIVEQFNFKSIRESNERMEQEQQQKNEVQANKIFHSFQFIKILCTLIENSQELEKELKKMYPKSGLLQKLKNINNYRQKKIDLKLLSQIYVRNTDLQDFQIMDYLQMFVLREMKKVPLIMMKLLPMKNTHMIGLKAEEKQDRLHYLYQQLLQYCTIKIETKEQQIFLNYFFDVSNSSQTSILTFAQIIINKFICKQKNKYNDNHLYTRYKNKSQEKDKDKDKEKGKNGNIKKQQKIKQKLQEKIIGLIKFQDYIKKLQQFLYLVFYQESSAYHRKMYEKIQNINLLIQKMILKQSDMYQYIKEQQSPSNKNQKKLNEQQKEQIIKFYHKLSKIIVEQKISSNILYSCFNIDPQKLEMKRLNFNVYNKITQQQFYNNLIKIKNYMKRYQQFEQLLESVQFFRFINLNKDTKNRRIDVYFFMDKLISLMQYNKNMLIKLNVITDENKNYQEEVGQQNPKTNNKNNNNIDINIYTQNQQSNQKQFKLQVETFCTVSLEHKWKNKKLEEINKKIQRSAQNLQKKLVQQWVDSSSFNVFIMCQEFQHGFLYTFTFSLLDRLIDNAKSNEINITSDKFTSNLNDFIKFMSLHFDENSDFNIMILFHKILMKFQNNKSIIQKLQKYSQKIYDKIISSILSNKNSKNLSNLRYFKDLFTAILNKPQISDSMKNRFREKITISIKKFINSGVRVCCLYDYQVLETLLCLWSQNQCKQSGQVKQNQLLQDPEILEWILKLFSKRNLHEIMGSNQGDFIKCKFALIMVKTIIKYEQTCSNGSLQLRNYFIKLQPTIKKLYNNYIAPRKQSYIDAQFCIGDNQCSQYYCNYEKLTKHEQNILDFFIYIFILTRIYLAKKDQGQIKVQQNFITQMIGQIKYKVYDQNRENRYSFRLPSFHIFKNKDIQESIMSEISSVESQNLYLYLHALSKVFEKQLTLVSKNYQKYLPFRYLLANKSIVKTIILLIFWILLILNLLNKWLEYDGDDEINLMPGSIVLKSMCIISVIIKILYTYQQLRLFINKWKYCYPLKYALKINTRSQYNQNKQQQSSSITLITSATTNIKNSIIDVKQEELCQNHYNQDNQRKNKQISTNKLSNLQLVTELSRNLIIFNVLHIILYGLTIYKNTFLMLLILFQAIDLEQCRDTIKAILYGFKKALYVLIIQVILIIFSFVYFISVFRQSENGHDKTPISNILEIFALQHYNMVIFGELTLENRDINSMMIPIQLAITIIVFIFSLKVVLHVSNNIYNQKDQKQQHYSKCFICKKTKQQLQKSGINFVLHLQNQHRVWDYLYFFIQFDRKNGYLHGIETQVLDQITNGDYRFIRLY